MMRLIGGMCAKLFSGIFWLLHNRSGSAFSREEIRWMQVSYSQFGEDLIVERLVKELAIGNGVYVDIGAFDPIAFSNTLKLHKLGWSGVNIDMNPTKVARFATLRPNDVNVCAAVGEGPVGTIQAFVVDRGTSYEKLHVGEQPPGKAEPVAISLRTLTDILDASRFAGKRIDYLNIDCEGMDFAVIQTLDMKKYSPRIVSIEALDDEALRAIQQWMSVKGYRLVDKLHWTLFFVADSTNASAETSRGHSASVSPTSKTSSDTTR